MLRCYIWINNLHNLLVLLLADIRKPSFRVTHTHLTLFILIKVKKSQLESEAVISESDVSRVWSKTSLRE